MTNPAANPANLEEYIDAAGGAINVLRAHKYDRIDVDRQYQPPQIVPQIPAEFSTWERESMSYRETVALIDQTHHMSGIFVSGPDAVQFLSAVACNKITGSKKSAKQIICCNEEGYLIGDGILFPLEDNLFSVYGPPFVPNWIAYQAKLSDLDVTTSFDERSPVYANGHGNIRPDCRYQIQGPKAGALIEKLNGGPIEDVRFFQQTELTIAGHRVRALRHGMAGAMGLELWAPFELRDTIREAIITAGEEFGLALVGSATYLVTAVESGWVQAPMAAIYSGKGMQEYRESLSANGVEALMRLSGSLDYSSIDDYYVTPFDLGYGNFIDFGHDFIGRSALEKMGRGQARKKVTLLWNPDDTADLFKEMMTPDGDDVRFLHLPTMNDKLECNFDDIRLDGKSVGFSFNPSYITGERSMLSLALVDQGVEVGDQVVVCWGEAGGGHGSRTVAPTRIVEIRAVVSSAPYSRVAREDYRTSDTILTA